MKRTFSGDSVRGIETSLQEAHTAFQLNYPGDPEERQPVHVVYGGAHLFRANAVKRLGELAFVSDEFAPDFITFAKALRLPESQNASPNRLAQRIHLRNPSKMIRKKSVALIPPSGSPTLFIAALKGSCSASPSKTFASISRMAMAIARRRRGRPAIAAANEVAQA